jgi:hypothetical protein
MDWLNDIGNILNQYSNSQPGQTPETAEQDFDQVARAAPREAVSSGLAEAFRSDQTPAFGSMLGNMFGNSNGMVKAGILNTLIAAAGPQVLSAIFGGHGGAASPGQITPEQAERSPPGAVEQAAEEARKQDPSVIDRVSDFYAEHPTIVKTLGAAALGVAMNHLAKQKRGLF